MNSLRFQMFVYSFQVIQTSSDPSLAYTLIKTVLTDKKQPRNNSETNKSTPLPFQNHGSKCDFECPIHRIINSGKIEGAYIGRVCSIFFTKNVT